MANIVLKDRNGSPVEHNGITQIAVGTEKFTHFTGLHLYLYYPTGTHVVITKKMLNISGNFGWFTGINEDELKQYGFKMDDGILSVGFVITSRGDLVVGNAYTADEVFGGE